MRTGLHRDETDAASHQPPEFPRADFLALLCRLVEERSLTLAEFAGAAASLPGVSLGLGDGGGLRALLREKPLKGAIR